MEVPARKEGNLARWGRYLRQTRLAGLVPLSWIMILLGGGVAAIAAVESGESLRDDPAPRPTSMARIFADKPIENRHVEVSGILLPDARLSFYRGRKNSPRPSELVYVALLGERERVLFVRFPADLHSGEPYHATLSGLLRPPEARLTRALDEINWKIGGAAVEPRYVLICGMTPRPFWLTAGVAVLAALLTAALLVAEFAAGRRGSRRPAEGHPVQEGEAAP